MATCYFDDFTIGSTQRSPEYIVNKDEIIEFAARWDPQPFHIDEASARASVFGGLTASACHTFAISGILTSRFPDQLKTMAALGMEELRFPNPVRPGDRLSLVIEGVDRRESRSRPTVGIVTARSKLTNQDGIPVMTLKSTFLMQRRPAEDQSGGNRPEDQRRDP